MRDYIKLIFTLSALCCSFFKPLNTIACTTIFWNNNGHDHVVARSMDLYRSDDPLLIVRPRGLASNGDVGTHSAEWTSKYGSLVVTAFRSTSVTDGMNEKGLAAHMLYLAPTKYPELNKQDPQLSNAMWAQYMLDNFATVKEAIDGTKHLQIVSTKLIDKDWPLHLAIEDASGDSAIIEFIDGKTEIHHGQQYQVLTNEPAYPLQLENLKKYQAFGGKLSLPGDTDPISRFVRASSYLKSLPKVKTEQEAVNTLLGVMRTTMVPYGAIDTSGNDTEDAWITRWVSLANLSNKRFYFDSTSSPNLIWVDLNKLNFAKGASTLSLDPMNPQLQGEVNALFTPVKADSVHS